MWTSLFPLAWSARSPCLELTSIVAGNGLTPPPAARISPRFRSSISLYGVTSMSILPTGGRPRCRPSSVEQHLILAERLGRLQEPADQSPPIIPTLGSHLAARCQWSGSRFPVSLPVSHAPELPSREERVASRDLLGS